MLNKVKWVIFFPSDPYVQTGVYQFVSFISEDTHEQMYMLKLVITTIIGTCVVVTVGRNYTVK